MKIYVASSWRNEFQHDVVKALREDGHEVYDFREDGDGWGRDNHGPGGFGWHEVGGPEWKNWVNDIPNFRRDMDALEQSEVCVMVHPCGVNAAMETGWACGAGKDVYVYVPGLREPDLMVKMAALITDDLDLIRSSIYATVNP